MLTDEQVKEFQEKLLDNKESTSLEAVQVLSDPTRMRIVRLLSKTKMLCVTDIAKILKLSVPAISYQMRILDSKGMVRKERHGQMMCYTLKKEEEAVERMMKIIK